MCHDDCIRRSQKRKTCHSPLPAPPVQHLHTLPLTSSIEHRLTRHYAVTSVIHARTGSVPPQTCVQPQPGATARGPAHHQQCLHQFQHRHRQYPDQHRPTSGPGERARQVQVQTRRAGGVAAAVAVVEAAVETAVPEPAAVVPEVAAAVAGPRVPRATHRSPHAASRNRAIRGDRPRPRPCLVGLQRDGDPIRSRRPRSQVRTSPAQRLSGLASGVRATRC